MKTAEEWVMTILSNTSFRNSHSVPVLTIDETTKLINEARKEAIEECAKRAQAELIFSSENVQTIQVNKESILSLIKELK